MASKLITKLFLISAIVQDLTSDQRPYRQLGDVNIAVMMIVSKSGPSGGCSDNIWYDYIADLEVVPHILDMINSNSSLLPNITLGYTILDTCGNALEALSLATSLVLEEKTISYRTTSNSTGMTTTNTSLDTQTRERYPVVGVLGPGYSESAVLVSSLLGLFQIPTLGIFTTLDDLSDKVRFPYFLRLVSPDHYSADAMVSVCEYFDWRYVSLVVSEGPYGENLAAKITRKLESTIICLGTTLRIRSDASDGDMDEIVHDLRFQSGAKVVLLAIRFNHAEPFFDALLRANVQSMFTFIGSETFAFIYAFGTEAIAGTIFLDFPGAPMADFERRVHSLKIEESTNPWLPELWEIRHNCSWKNFGNYFPCQSFESLNLTGNPNVYSKMADGLMVYAHALHNLIQEKCPEQFSRSRENSELLSCIKSNNLFDYMKKVNFSGFSDEVAFDDSGDSLGTIAVKQVKWSPERGLWAQEVGSWYRGRETLVIEDSLISHDVSTLESVCSQPCQSGQYYQVKQLVCCWECLNCRTNEITNTNKTACLECPLYTWPDETQTSCEKLTPHYLQKGGSVGICLTTLATLGILISVLVFVVYQTKPKNKLLMATSRELSMIVLGGCIVTCGIALLFVRYPDDPTCQIRQTGFHFAVNMTFVPLLMKTSRIYRVFRASKRGTARPSFVSTGSQLALTFLLIGIQVVLLIALEMKFTSYAVLQMPFQREPYVEITCSAVIQMFLPPICYNMAIILACSVFGFLTRKLPENFNDSRFIFFSMATTFFTWVVTLPTYFTTFHSHHQAALAAVCLLLNAYITLLCQFVPKVYAVYFVHEEKMTLKMIRSGISEEPSTSP